MPPPNFRSFGEAPNDAREARALPRVIASSWSSVLGDYTLTHFKQSKESVSQTYRKVLSVKLSVRSVSSAVWRASDW